jgi:Tfp pilus assembly protein PilX
MREFKKRRAEMVQSNRNHNSRYNRSQRGQTLIIALIVLFALLFLGGVFVTRIARNLQQSGRTQQSGEAAALAQAGLDYCNQELNTSPQGADWRPMPSTPINNQDPDIYWLV